jgi:hypothetical protein
LVSPYLLLIFDVSALTPGAQTSHIKHFIHPNLTTLIIWIRIRAPLPDQFILLAPL